VEDRTVAELMARIEQLESQRRPRRQRPRARLVVGALTLIALLAVPIGAFASHSFTDVPDSNTFHTNIGRVKGAGITAGCTATTYCPDANVTRGQMAAFLARTGGRASGVTMLNTTVPGNGTPVDLGSFDIKAGDVTGGSAAIAIDLSVAGFIDGLTGCPCALTFSVDVQGVTQLTAIYIAIDSLNYQGVYGVGNADVSLLVPVPTGVTQTVTVSAAVSSGTRAFTAYGHAVATYVPFAATGGNYTLSAPAGEGAMGPPAP
jgi:hypothetical protein